MGNQRRTLQGDMVAYCFNVTPYDIQGGENFRELIEETLNSNEAMGCLFQGIAMAVQDTYPQFRPEEYALEIPIKEAIKTVSDPVVISYWDQRTWSPFQIERLAGALQEEARYAASATEHERLVLESLLCSVAKVCRREDSIEATHEVPISLEDWPRLDFRGNLELSGSLDCKGYEGCHVELAIRFIEDEVKLCRTRVGEDGSFRFTQSLGALGLTNLALPLLALRFRLWS